MCKIPYPGVQCKRFLKKKLKKFFKVKYTAMYSRKIKVSAAFGIPVYLDFSLIILLFLFMMDIGSFIYGLSFVMA